MKKITKYTIGLFAAAALAVSVAYTPNYFEISKQLDIFTSIFKEVNLYYVDETQPGELMTEAIESMLYSLDPYTTYIPEERVEDYKIQTTGHYGGIGATIRQKQDSLVIVNTYEGFSADKAGLKPGDFIISIDGKGVAGKSTDDVSKILKGAPGTEVTLSLLRNGTMLTKELEREDVQVKSVPYYGMLPGHIAYVSLNSFTNKASKEIKGALEELKENQVDAIILDLRGNPGGLLSEAVNVSNLFIEKGKEVVNTKGKMEEWEKSYKTLNQPDDTETPIAVLINSGSASASEIVAGTLQDYDRGVVIGQRSFGKGLVQQTRKLSYGAQLKVTIAKYYTPSGRCIQAINYAERAEDGSVEKIPDSLRTRFETEAGRPVFDGGGIDPDLVVEKPKINDAIVGLFRDMLIFDYATAYTRSHSEIAPAAEFSLSDEEYGKFISWLKKRDFNYDTDTEKNLQQMEKSARQEGYYEAIKAELEALKNQYVTEENGDLKEYRVEVKQLLEEEIVSRYYYDSGRIANSLSHDKEVGRAREVLLDQDKYQNILTLAAQ
ncbi:MAG: S41 family peptidase [Owenweeksia sp.]|nr:S41 family peptidase [Owenweeksia sp.]